LLLKELGTDFQSLSPNINPLGPGTRQKPLGNSGILTNAPVRLLYQLDT